MLALLRRRPDFRRLWLGQVVSYLGDWLTYVAVSLIALASGDGLIAVALVLVAHTVPHAFLAPLAGSLTDRMDRRKVMIWTALLRGVLTIAMAAAAFGGSLWAVQGLLLLRVSVGAFFMPAQTAALPRLVERDEIQLANALTSVTWSVMFSLGVAAGGLVSALVGPALAIAIDAVTFFGAAAVLWPLPAMEPEGGLRDSRLGSVIRELHRDMAEAWRHAWADPPLLEAVLAKTPVLAATGGAWVFLNQVAEDHSFAGSAALTLGVLQTARGIGTGIGPLLEPKLEARTSTNVSWMVAAVLTFAAIAALPLSHQPVAMLTVVFLWGCGIGANWVAATSRLQRVAPDALMGRLASIDMMALTAGETITALLGACLGEWLSDSRMAAWSAVAFGVAAWVLLRGLVRARLRVARARPKVSP